MKQRVLISARCCTILTCSYWTSRFGIDVTSAQLFQHLLTELAGQGKTILYISHVLEVVEKVCGQVVIIYKGKIRACDSVEKLRI